MKTTEPKTERRAYGPGALDSAGAAPHAGKWLTVLLRRQTRVRSESDAFTAGVELLMNRHEREYRSGASINQVTFALVDEWISARRGLIQRHQRLRRCARWVKAGGAGVYQHEVDAVPIVIFLPGGAR